MPTCCVCGKELPNKYAIAARCSEPGCEAVFCTLHAATWNKRCPDHGGSETTPLHAEEPHAESAESAEDRTTERPNDRTTMEETPTSDEALVKDAKARMPASRMRGILSAVGEFAAKAGKIAGDLVRRIRNEKDPEEMLKAIDASLAANREKRRPIFDRNTALATEIGAKKKVYEAAPAARKKMLELELRNLLAEYKANERQLTAFFENENALTVVRGRLLEQIALGMQTLKEDDIDKLTDDIEDAVADAENISDAVRDLDKAGKRRERDSDAGSFADELAAFDAPSEETHAESAESAEAKPHAESAETVSLGSPAGGAGERSEPEGVAHAEPAASPDVRAPSRPVPESPAEA